MFDCSWMLDLRFNFLGSPYWISSDLDYWVSIGSLWDLYWMFLESLLDLSCISIGFISSLFWIYIASLLDLCWISLGSLLDLLDLLDLWRTTYSICIESTLDFIRCPLGLHWISIGSALDLSWIILDICCIPIGSLFYLCWISDGSIAYCWLLIAY